MPGHHHAADWNQPESLHWHQDRQVAFSNQQETEFALKKRLSPSQRKRSFERKEIFVGKKFFDDKNYEFKKEIKHGKVHTKDSESQTENEDKVEQNNSKAQTDISGTENLGTNTEIKVENKPLEEIDDELAVDQNGQIHPRKNEVIL